MNLPSRDMNLPNREFVRWIFSNKQPLMPPLRRKSKSRVLSWTSVLLMWGGVLKPSLRFVKTEFLDKSSTIIDILPVFFEPKWRLGCALYYKCRCVLVNLLISIAFMNSYWIQSFSIPETKPYLFLIILFISYLDMSQNTFKISRCVEKNLF